MTRLAAAVLLCLVIGAPRQDDVKSLRRDFLRFQRDLVRAHVARASAKDRIAWKEALIRIDEARGNIERVRNSLLSIRPEPEPHPAFLENVRIEQEGRLVLHVQWSRVSMKTPVRALPEITKAHMKLEVLEEGLGHEEWGTPLNFGDILELAADLPAPEYQIQRMPFWRRHDLKPVKDLASLPDSFPRQPEWAYWESVRAFEVAMLKRAWDAEPTPSEAPLVRTVHRQERLKPGSATVEVRFSREPEFAPKVSVGGKRVKGGTFEVPPERVGGIAVVVNGTVVRHLNVGEATSYCFVLDSTAKPERMKEAVTGLVLQMKEWDEVCLFVFDREIRRVLPFTVRKKELIREIESWSPGEGRALADAIRLAGEYLADHGRYGNKAMVVLTSGGEREGGDPVREAATVRRRFEK